eukprot:15442379-Alexandrium_andersonii.AAC.1
MAPYQQRWRDNGVDAPRQVDGNNAGRCFPSALNEIHNEHKQSERSRCLAEWLNDLMREWLKQVMESYHLRP